MKKTLRYLVPVWLKKRLKYVFYALLDLKDFLLGQREERYPPRRLNFVGSHDFKAVGDEFFNHFKVYGRLQRSDRVLDIGSGIGRMAIPLTNYLEEGRYEGFDIDRRGVEWCQQHLSATHPHFNFQYVDLYNKFYNAKGALRSSEFRFPYEDGSFDFVFATSVFTHLLPADAQHYLSEIKRVLSPGGRALLTWFVLDETSLRLMSTPASNAHFSHQETDFCFYSHVGNPEAEIAYTKDWLRAQMPGELKIHAGTWCGQTGVTYQDMVVWKP